MSRENAAALAATLGLALVVASFFWSGWRTGASEWTEADASQYQAISADLHRKSFSARTPEAKAALDALQADYESLQSRLVAASGRGESEAFWMKVAGGVLVAIAIGISATPEKAPKRRS